MSHLIESMLVNDVTRLAMKVQNVGFPVKETYRRWRGILLILTHTRVVSKVPYHLRAFFLLLLLLYLFLEVFLVGIEYFPLCYTPREIGSRGRFGGCASLLKTFICDFNHFTTRTVLNEAISIATIIELLYEINWNHVLLIPLFITQLLEWTHEIAWVVLTKISMLFRRTLYGLL